jgi:hypothetical protein
MKKDSNEKETFEFEELIQKEKENALQSFRQEDLRSRIKQKIEEEQKKPFSQVFWLRKPVIVAGSILLLIVLGWILARTFVPAPYEREARAIRKDLVQALRLHGFIEEAGIPIEPQPGSENLYELEWSIKRVIYAAHRESITDEDIPQLLRLALQDISLIQQEDKNNPEEIKIEKRNDSSRRENHFHQLSSQT